MPCIPNEILADLHPYFTSNPVRLIFWTNVAKAWNKDIVATFPNPYQMIFKVVHSMMGNGLKIATTGEWINF